MLVNAKMFPLHKFPMHNIQSDIDIHWYQDNDTEQLCLRNVKRRIFDKIMCVTDNSGILQ
jgi:hypothetical protein